MGIYAIKVTGGKEVDVAITLEAAAKKGDYDVFAIFVPSKLKGLVFVEASSVDEVYFLVRGVPYIKRIIKEPIPFHEIEPLLKEEKKEIELDKGDIVEIISGPFKGERGRVTRIDKSKDQVVVELISSVVPMPLTVSIDDIKLLEKVKTK
jgi:transcriptional antiterminator NusG